MAKKPAAHLAGLLVGKTVAQMERRLAVSLVGLSVEVSAERWVACWAATTVGRLDGRLAVETAAWRADHWDSCCWDVLLAVLKAALLVAS